MSENFDPYGPSWRPFWFGVVAALAVALVVWLYTELQQDLLRYIAAKGIFT